MSPSIATRLAGYTAIAAAPAAAVGDIQVYEGPPIPLDGSYANLSLAGLEFAMFNSIYTERQSGWWGGATQCCGYYTTSWGYQYCTFYTQTQNFSAQEFVQLEVGCTSNLVGVRFRPLGAPVGSPACADTSQLCFVSIWSNQSCYGGDFGSFGSCDVEGTYYVGFEAVRDTKGDFAFVQGWMKIEGSASDLAITRWAFEDSGGSINVGDEPPAACPGDFNTDGTVDGEDFGILLGNFGNKGGGVGDLNDDNVIDGGDVGLFLGFWGQCP